MLPADEIPVRLSVAIIVRDAAEALAETLVSIRNVADEIVVLDTGSCDESQQLARSLGARVYERPWDDHFATARNACLTYTQGAWVLWLDAGETLGKDDARLLKEFIEQHADPGTAYSLRVALPAVDELSAGEQVERVRLHPRRQGIQFSGRVRENLDRALFAFGIGVDSLPLTIHRGRRDLEAEVKQSRAERNLVLAELQLAERGGEAETHNCLGEACQALSRQEQAAVHYRQALKLAERGSTAQLEAYYGLLTTLETIGVPLPDDQGQDPRRTAQLSLCMTALETFPLDAQLLCALGGYLQSLGRGDLAIKAYDVCYHHGQIDPALWHLPDIRQIAASCQATLLELTGQPNAALELLQDARKAYPESIRLLRQMLELHVQHGHRDEALVLAGQLPHKGAAHEALRTGIIGACAGVKGSWIAARSYLRTAVEAGCRERFVWRWLATSLLALDERAEVEAVLSEWESLDSQSREPVQFRQALEPAPKPAASAGAVAGRSVRIDAPEDATGPSVTPAATPAGVSRASQSQ